MQLRGTLAVAVLALLSALESARAQCGAWETHFNPVGLAGIAFTALSFDDGNGAQLYVGGGFLRAGNVPALRVARWDGLAWHPVGAGLGGIVNELIAHDFGAGPRLVATSGNTVQVFDGSTWQQLGGAFDGELLALSVFDDGSGPRLYAGGDFDDNAGNTMLGIARWSGTSWQALGNGLGTLATNGVVVDMCVHDDGSGLSLFAGGLFPGNATIASHDLMRWDGTNWHAVGGGVDPDQLDYLRTLTVFDDGGGPRLLLGGKFNVAGGNAANNVASWDGASYAQYGGGLNAEVFELTTFAALAGDELVAGGAFSSGGSFGVVHAVAGSWQALGTTGIDQTVECLTTHDDGNGPRLIAVGSFSTMAPTNTASNYIAQWDGSTWSPFQDGAGLNGEARAFAGFDDGSGPRLFVGGTFTTAGVVLASRLARWDGSAWSALPLEVDGPVNALLTWDDGSGAALYAAGMFVNAGGSPLRRVGRWDGTQWTSLGNGIGSPNFGVSAVSHLAVFDDGSGPKLYAAGFFNLADDAPALNIACWDGSSWSDLDLGVDTTVLALAVYDDGSGANLFAGGDFTDAGGLTVSNIARWDGSDWHALGAGVTSTGGVKALRVFNDGSGPMLYAGGTFSSMDGVPAPGLARWDGSSWSAVAAPFATNELLLVADLGDGPDLLVATGSSIQRRANGNWIQVGAHNYFFASGLGLFDSELDGTPDLYVGGSFSFVEGSIPTHRIASFRGCVTSATEYCSGDGSASACPCGNTGFAGHGCDNSIGSGGAHLSVSGVPSVSNDSLRLACDSLTPNTTTLFVQSTAQSNGGMGIVLGDGLLCIAGAVLRVGSPIAQGDVASVGFGAQLQNVLSVKGQIPQAGATRHYQVRYRNLASFCTPATFNQSNGASVVWVP